MSKLIRCGDPAVCAAEVAAVLARPGCVALVPTETVYGLVARVGDQAAYERIFELKQRSPAKVLGWFVGDWRALGAYGVKLAGLPERLAERYFPGPLTVIAPLEGGGTLGFRSPDHPFLQALLKLTGPLYQTSANLSGRPDPEDAAAALAELTAPPDIAVDAGPLSPDARSSTVVDAAGAEPKILRQGNLVVDLTL